MIIRIKKPPDVKSGGQSVEKIEFAREAGILNPFFASALPRQKTLLSAQLCELSALPTMSAGSADASAEKSQRDFFDGPNRPMLSWAGFCVKLLREALFEVFQKVGVFLKRGNVRVILLYLLG